MKEPTLRLALLAGFACFVVLLALAPISNNDIWLHLKTGSLILERGRLPQADEYTFTRAGTPCVAHEWLAQALFALLYRAGGGMAPLSLLHAAFGATLLWLLYRQSARGVAREAPDLPGMVLPCAGLATLAAFYLVTLSLATRPHLFTFLLAPFCAGLLSRLEASPPRARERRGIVAALLILQVLWANLHGGFVVGILLASIHAAASALRRRRPTALLALPAALAAVSCVNPSGWRLYALVARFSDPVFRRVIVEWESPFETRFAATPMFAVYVVWLAVALAAAARSAARRRDAAPLMTALAFGAMSAVSRRHISLLAILTAPLVAEALARALAPLTRRFGAKVPRAAGWAAAGMTLAMAGLTARALVSDPGMPLRPGVVARNIPVEALEVMRAEGLRGRVFTTIGLGSYVTWRGWPDLTTSIDSRLEVFGGEFITAHMLASRDPARFSQMAAREPFDFALLPWRLASAAGALAALRSDPGWALVYFDDVVVLYARRASGHEDLIARRAYGALDPARFAAEGGFDRRADPTELDRETRRALEDPPALPHRPPVNTVALAMRRLLAGTPGRPPTR